MTTCAVTPDQRLAFAAGELTSLDEHVAGCEGCQDFLADLWSGGLSADLTGPVMRVGRLEQFLIDVAKESGGVAARLVEAMLAYGVGRSPDE